LTFRARAPRSKKAVLFNQGESYMVHASRREKPGMAEIHTKDADIVYVLDGSATLVDRRDGRQREGHRA
jgi:hypothetical protein